MAQESNPSKKRKLYALEDILDDFLLMEDNYELKYSDIKKESKSDIFESEEEKGVKSESKLTVSDPIEKLMHEIKDMSKISAEIGPNIGLESFQALLRKQLNHETSNIVQKVHISFKALKQSNRQSKFYLKNAKDKALKLQFDLKAREQDISELESLLESTQSNNDKLETENKRLSDKLKIFDGDNSENCSQMKLDNLSLGKELELKCEKIATLQESIVRIKQVVISSSDKVRDYKEKEDLVHSLNLNILELKEKLKKTEVNNSSTNNDELKNKENLIKILEDKNSQLGHKLENMKINHEGVVGSMEKKIKGCKTDLNKTVIANKIVEKESAEKDVKIKTLESCGKKNSLLIEKHLKAIGQKEIDKADKYKENTKYIIEKEKENDLLKNTNIVLIEEISQTKTLLTGLETVIARLNVDISSLKSYNKINTQILSLEKNNQLANVKLEKGEDIKMKVKTLEKELREKQNEINIFLTSKQSLERQVRNCSKMLQKADQDLISQIYKCKGHETVIFELNEKIQEIPPTVMPKQLI